MKKKTSARARKRLSKISTAPASGKTSPKSAPIAIPEVPPSSLKGLCARERGEPCPNRQSIKDPAKVCERETAFRARLRKKLAKPDRLLTPEDEKELEEPYCTYPLSNSLDVAQEDIEQQYEIE